jgi:arylsulfatase A-like enzyme
MITRREMLQGLLAGGAMAMLPRLRAAEPATTPAVNKPNILVIMADQQNADAIGRLAGHGHLRTPALDRLVGEGMRFSRAYTASPVCVPARNSLFTGRFPHQTEIECNRAHPRNDRRMGSARLADSVDTLGTLFRDGEYHTAYFGRWHLCLDTRDTDRHGFGVTGALRNTGGDPQIAASAAAFLREQGESGGERPFCAVASFCDPHDICQFADGRPLPGGPLPPPPPTDQLPPAVPNLKGARNEPDILARLRQAYYVARNHVQVTSERQARELAWAYHRLVERVDAHIGQVLDALREAGLADRTVVVFTSDHGELLGAHGLVQKTFFFENAVHVPLVVRAPGLAPGTCDAFANNCVDTIPTLLGLAGIPVPDRLPGRDLSPWLRGERPAEWPDHVVSSMHFCAPGMPEDTPLTYARMVRTGQFKYWLFDQGEQREALYDMEEDPGELENLAGPDARHPWIAAGRDRLREHARATGDARSLAMLDAAVAGPGARG